MRLCLMNDRKDRQTSGGRTWAFALYKHLESIGFPWNSDDCGQLAHCSDSDLHLPCTARNCGFTISVERSWLALQPSKGSNPC